MSEDSSGFGFWSDGPVEKVPMHPEDFRALLAWVRAKEGWKMQGMGGGLTRLISVPYRPFAKIKSYRVFMKTKILFICTHNSARSQMAEGYMHAKYSDHYEVFSGGTEVTRVHPMAIAVMQEIGIDISDHRSKRIDVFFGKGIGTVVTVCDSAQDACPFFPGTQDVIHQSFPDPTVSRGTDEEVRAGFRSVRDKITRWIDGTFGTARV